MVENFSEEGIGEITSSRRQFGAHLLPDLQTAVIDQANPFSPALLGVHQAHDSLPLTISSLMVRSGHFLIPITPLQFQDMDLGEAEPFAVLNNGLWLFRTHDRPVAVLLSNFTKPMVGNFTQVEIATLADAESLAFARRFLVKVQADGAGSVLYRGKVLSFENASDYSGMKSELQVHKLPAISRDAVILNAATMARLDQHIFDFDNQREALKSLGQSTRKGVLLYGPPGTGKTHIIRYIASNLPDRTTILMTAEQVKNLGQYMLLARTLQPSIVVLEDVDLVGRSRESMNSPKTEILLNRLLNEMDGLRDDADILFILTTNRPEDIEEALASRPGRVDEAIEVTNPDEACRARLVELYGRKLAFAEGAVEAFVERSVGGSAAFVKEMVRRLAQTTLSAGRANRVELGDVVIIMDQATTGTRIERQIVGLSHSARGGKDAQPFDECGSDLST